MRYTLTENKLRSIIQEAVQSVLLEAQGIQSQKLYNIYQQHGGFRRTNCLDIHNLTDDDVLTVLPRETVNQITSDRQYIRDYGRWADSYGLDVWAKQNGVKLQPGDRIATIDLKDGQCAIVINRNEGQVAGREGEGWDAYYQKREQRRKDSQWDGKNRYIHKYYDPERSTMWKNPYKRGSNWSQKDIDDTMDRIRQRRNIARTTGELTGGLQQNY